MTDDNTHNSRFIIRTALSAHGESICELIVNGFVEKTVLDLTTWRIEDYECQWREALVRIVQGVDSKVVLMTWASKPTLHRILRAWRLQREDVNVRLQERIYVPEDYEFDVDDQGVVIDHEDMQGLNEEGDRISEWRTTIDAIRDFLDNDLTLRR